MLRLSAFKNMQASILLSRGVAPSSLGGIPEDLLVQILELLNVMDILALRLTSRRMYAITKARLVWLRALQHHFKRRSIPPPMPSTTLTMTNEEIEREALRPARFLHALADVEFSEYRVSEYHVEDKTRLEEVFTPSEEDDPRIGIVAFRIMPGGRWAVLAANIRTAHVAASARGMILIWDLLKKQLRWKYPVGRPMHYASVQQGADAKGVDVVVGLDKSKAEDPLFVAIQVAYPPDTDEQSSFIAIRAGGIRVPRTARATSVLGSLVAFVDRNGSMSFWDWKEKTSAAMHVTNWPPSKGKIMLLSKQHIAIFNTTLSTFSVHCIPPPTCINIPSPAAANPSQPLMKSRLPAKNLMITFPHAIPASSFRTSNSEFRDPFAAYYLVVHPGVSSHLHIGIIPEISIPGDARFQTTGPLQEDLEWAVPEADDSQQEIPHHTILNGSPDSSHPPENAAPSSPDPSSLQFMRCIDPHTDTAFTRHGRVLWAGPIDSSMGVIRCTDEGLLEIFTTSALTQSNRSQIAVANGDYQLLSYRPPGKVWAVSVDDISGKICLLVQDIEKAYRLVELDFGSPLSLRGQSGAETESENDYEEDDDDDDEADDADTCRSPY